MSRAGGRNDPGLRAEFVNGKTPRESRMPDCGEAEQSRQPALGGASLYFNGAVPECPRDLGCAGAGRFP